MRKMVAFGWLSFGTGKPGMRGWSVGCHCPDQEHRRRGTEKILILATGVSWVEY